MKSALLSSSILILCALGLYEVTQEFQRQLALSTAEEKADNILSSSTQRLQYTADERVGLVLQTWQDVADDFPSTPDALIGLARAHLAASARELTFPARIEHLCSTLVNLSSAAAKSPSSARLQISLADIKSQITDPSRSCPEQTQAAILSPLSAEQHLERALKLQPFNTSIMYLAASVYRALDQKEKSLVLLRKVQEISSMSRAQRDYTYAMVESQRELEVALPRKYPEIISWYSHFERNRPYQLQSWNDTFVAGFQEALNELKTRLRSGVVSPEEYGRFVIQISSQTAISTSDMLRKEIDGILSVAYQLLGKTEWSQILARRSRMERIPIAKSFLQSDKTPRSTMLSHWVADDQHLERYLDSRGGSIGLFVPPNRTLRMLVIESGEGAPRVAPESLELFASEDNREFVSLQRNFEAEAFSVDGVQNIVFTFEKAPFRYLKIVSNASGRRQFRAPLSRLLQAFE